MESRRYPKSVPPPTSPTQAVPTTRPVLGDAPQVAGESARQEHDRRRTKRLARDRDHYGQLLGTVVSQLNTPSHETAWATGAGGEEKLAECLAKACGPDVILFHDRRFPGRRANVDHLAVTPRGVWVIDTKRYRGDVHVERKLLRPPKLTIAGRDQTKLVDGVRRQADHVAELLGVDVTAALCFVDADLPLGGLGSAGDVQLLSPRRLAKQLRRSGPVSAETRADLATKIDAGLPGARH